jgi:hypothetical protein
MTEAQRVGQLFLVGIAGAPAAEVAQAVSAYHFGSLLFQGTSTAGLAADRQMTQAIQSLASSAATARVRFFIAAGLSPATRGIDFLAAGGDLITSQSLPAAVAMDQAILAQAAGDAAFRSTVKSAVMRILDAKQAYHLMPCR